MSRKIIKGVQKLFSWATIWWISCAQCLEGQGKEQTNLHMSARACCLCTWFRWLAICCNTKDHRPSIDIPYPHIHTMSHWFQESSMTLFLSFQFLRSTSIFFHNVNYWLLRFNKFSLKRKRKRRSDAILC